MQHVFTMDEIFTAANFGANMICLFSLTLPIHNANGATPHLPDLAFQCFVI